MATPYQAPMAPKHAQPDVVGQMLSPLVHCAGWLQLIGWANIILGALYCLTIVGIIIGWLPIWIGISCKSAGEAFKNAQATGDPNEIYRGNRNLATVIKIVGVLVIINIALLCLYLLAALLFFAVGLTAAAANA